MAKPKVKIKKRKIKKTYQVVKNGGLIIAPSRVGYTLLGNSKEAVSFQLKVYTYF